MKENQQEPIQNPDSDVFPVLPQDRTLTGFSNFSIWFACNLVVTTMLTGMLMVPDLAVGQAIKIIFIASVVGVVPLVLIGVIGQKTGLTTMVASRATFGSKGSILPSSINILILVAWSWAQAGLGGLAIDYAVEYLSGYSNPILFTILTEILVVGIALFAIKGIAAYEKFAMVLIVIIAGAVIFKAFSSIGITSILDIPAISNGGLTAIAAFDIVVATALSWTPMAADYNRNSKTLKGTVIGTGTGFALGTTLSMGVGALMIGMIMASGLNLTYEPSHVFGEIGFGIAGSIVIFLSIIAANVMIIYSSTMSFINIFPKARYKKTAIIIGIICVIGAVYSGILDSFLNFVYLIGVLFMPIFAIMIADFFVLKKMKYNVDAIVYPEKDDTYRYTGGINWIAVVVFAISAFMAFYWGNIASIAIGGTIPTFALAFILYIVAMKLFDKNSKRIKA